MQVLATMAAMVVVLVGAVPMASAAVNPNADPILAVAVDGTPNTVDLPAPAFALSTRRAGRYHSGSARPDRGAHLPRPGLHIGLPADRPGVP